MRCHLLYVAGRLARSTHGSKYPSVRLWPEFVKSLWNCTQLQHYTSCSNGPVKNQLCWMLDIVHPKNPCYENNYLFWMVDALNDSNRQRASLAVIVTMKYHWLETHAFAKLFFEVGKEKSYSLSLLSSERCMEFCSVLFPCWLAYEFRKKHNGDH